MKKGEVPRITLRRFPRWREGAPNPAGDDMRPNPVGLGGVPKFLKVEKLRKTRWKLL